MCLRAHIFSQRLGQTVTRLHPRCSVIRSLVIGRWSFASAVEKKRERLGPMLAACTILHHEYLRHKYINRGCGLGEVPPISARIAGVVLNSKLVACNRLRAAEP